MIGTKMTIEEFKGVIKEVVEEVVRKEILNLRVSLLPFVSDEEQEEVEKMFGEKPIEEPVVYEEDVEI
jgi:hypothetical protein